MTLGLTFLSKQLEIHEGKRRIKGIGSREFVTGSRVETEMLLLSARSWWVGFYYFWFSIRHIAPLSLSHATRQSQSVARGDAQAPPCLCVYLVAFSTLPEVLYLR